MDQEQIEEMERLALPLVEFLRKHGDTGQSIEITQERIRLLSVDYSYRVATSHRHNHEPNFGRPNSDLACGTAASAGNFSKPPSRPKDPPPQPTKKGICINVGPVDIAGTVEIGDVCKRLSELIEKSQSTMARGR